MTFDMVDVLDKEWRVGRGHSSSRDMVTLPLPLLQQLTPVEHPSGPAKQDPTSLETAGPGQSLVQGTAQRTHDSERRFSG